eukprot:4166670-Pyramimonas_sp.AAC.1
MRAAALRFAMRSACADRAQCPWCCAPEMPAPCHAQCLRRPERNAYNACADFKMRRRRLHPNR